MCWQESPRGQIVNGVWLRKECGMGKNKTHQSPPSCVKLTEWPLCKCILMYTSSIVYICAIPTAPDCHYSPNMHHFGLGELSLEVQICQI